MIARENTDTFSRHDLRPVTSTASNADATAPATSADGDELPPPLAAENGAETSEEVDAPQRRRISRFLDRNRLRHAPPDERIAALRRLREHSQREGGVVEGSEQRSGRARLTGRLRDTFRIRTRPQTPSS